MIWHIPPASGLPGIFSISKARGPRPRTVPWGQGDDVKARLVLLPKAEEGLGQHRVALAQASHSPSQGTSMNISPK